MNAWLDAAKELGIRVEIPFSLVSVDGETELYEGRAIDFGGPNGIVFGIFDDDEQIPVVGPNRRPLPCHGSALPATGPQLKTKCPRPPNRD